jgi:hypothetical protein
MKTALRTLAATFAALLLMLLTAPDSAAQCGGLRQPAISPASWNVAQGRAGLVRTALDDFDGDTAIVGFWHVKFVSIGSQGIPDNTEVDAGYSQWHSDGTEIMNSGGRSPITSSFCLGVWSKVGVRKFQLNHFAIAWDPTGQHLIGPANIRELVTLGPDCNTFSGSFTIDQFDESGNRLAHVQGNITATRIDVNTAEKNIF